MLSGVEVELPERRAELHAVLHSREFLRAPALAKLLEYLCEKTFTGHTFEIKEFSIATEVFGRASDYGEKRDSLVRVEVHRLRKKLERFYEAEGATHPIRILIRPGNYQPDFERVFDAPAEPEPTPEPEGTPEPGPANILPAPAGLSAGILPKPATVTAVEPQPGRSRWTAAVLLSLVLVLAAALIVFLKTRAVDAPAPHTAIKSHPAPGAPAAPALAPLPVRILVGSAMDRLTDRFGAVWSGDRYFTGGYQDSLRFGNQERAVPHPLILGAPDQTPFHSFRAGAFTYRIPLPAGRYELRLYFSEVVFGISDSGDGAENSRVFDVLMNGQPLLTYYDIFASAGAANTADIRVFENVSPAADGFLTLDFRPVREVAWLNAIELIPNATGIAEPLRIVARPADYIDAKHQVWGSDRYFLGGRESSDGKLPAGTGDPELFERQRYGRFSYRLPAPPGRYRLRLLFAETFYGPDNRGKGGVGSRIFNVYSSGTTLLHQFDVFKEAGENRALEKVFHGLQPNAQGRIELTFEPVVNYAIVQAIELVNEGR
jgi:hypothetical protein